MADAAAPVHLGLPPSGMIWAQARELAGSALDWAAAQAMGYTDVQVTDFDEPSFAEQCFFRPAKLDSQGRQVCGSGMPWSPTESWSQSGVVVESLVAQGYTLGSDPQEIDSQYKFSIAAPWHAKRGQSYYGETLRVAALRCLVSVRVGEWIAIPTCLLRHKQAMGEVPTASAPRGREHG